jgi:hypothetical protein
MSGILTSTQASGSAVTGHLCPKTDVVASKWIAIATITAVFGHTSPNEPSWRHKMLESADLARLPSDRGRKWEIPVQTQKGNRNYYEKRIFYKVLFPYCSPISNLCDRMRPTCAEGRFDKS